MQFSKIRQNRIIELLLNSCFSTYSMLGYNFYTAYCIFFDGVLLSNRSNVFWALYFRGLIIIYRLPFVQNKKNELFFLISIRVNSL